ncbi:MAG: HAD-superfamily hydrolase, subfamily [Actinomycetia bacterium]|nr:HAD-superfamily hydrolase, subfamily [Actinomycetes bacterium]
MTSPPSGPARPAVALFDWDGTLHQRATIRAFAGFLVERGLLDAAVDRAMDAAYLDYHVGSSTHDVLVERVVGAYAAAMSGLAVGEIAAQAEAFVEVDVDSLRPWAAPLLVRIAAMGIDPVVISGSPESVLREHARRLPIRRIFGVLLDERDGRYAGTVAHNTGLAREKAATVRAVAATHSVVVAFGDSRSDLPLLHAARLPVLVGEMPMDEEPRALLVGADGSGLDAVWAALQELTASS